MAARTEADAPQVAGEIILVPVAEVALGERLRPVDPFWAQALGNVMVREGQQTPIEICRLPGRAGWTLVAGAHRLEGARLVGMELIEARVVSASQAHRRMREVSENLWRRDLDPIDRAAFVAELVTLHKQARGIDPSKDGRTASAQVRWQKELKKEALDATDTLSVVYGFGADVAGEVGLSERTVRRDLLIFRRITPSVSWRLREARHPILRNASQLRALTKFDPTAQARIADQLISGAANVAAAAVRAGLSNKAKPEPDAKRRNAIISAWSRMGIAEKRGFLPEFVGLLTPGLRAELATLLTEAN